MNNPQLTSVLKRQIENLPFNRHVGFALDICKRLLPEYINFHERNRWGNPEKLTGAISFCEKNKGNVKAEVSYIADIKVELETVIPDTEDFGDWDGSYALNASCSVLELLEYLEDKDIDHIFNISTFMTDTIDFKLSEIDGGLSHEQLIEHPKILQELLYQIEITK